MAKIVIDCSNPNDFQEIIEAAENAAGSCTITYAKHHLELLDVGASTSRKESSRIIASETGETPGSVEQKIIRGEKALQGVAQEENQTNSNTSSNLEKLEKTWGGTREGSGRKSKGNPEPSLTCSIGSDGTENQNIITFDASDEDQWRDIGEKMSEKIQSGEIKPRVGTTVSAAVKNALRKEVKPEPKAVDNFDRLKRHVLSVAEGLNFWADGTMKPESEDEAIAARIILHSAPSIITHYSRLGINILAIYETFIDPNRRENTNETKEIAS